LKQLYLKHRRANYTKIKEDFGSASDYFDFPDENKPFGICNIM